MFRTIAITLCLATPLSAETFVSDAFGILPDAALSSERAAWSGLRQGSSPEMVAPERADAVLIFIGPKALVAGKDNGHAVALAFDRHGNLVQEAEAVFSLDSAGRPEAAFRDGIADVLFRPDPKAGTFAGGASVGNLQSPRALFRVTADLDSVRPALADLPLIGAETFGTMASIGLSDQFGNPVEDGTGATFLLSHDSGETTLLSAPVREAMSEATVLGRDMSDGGSVTMRVGRSSGTGSFNYQSQMALSEPGLQLWSIDDIGALGLRLGPVTTADGFLLNDGAPVSVKLSSEDGASVRARGWLQGGYFQTVLRRPADQDPLTVTFETALGSETRLVSISPDVPQPIRGVE